MFSSFLPAGRFAGFRINLKHTKHYKGSWPRGRRHQRADYAAGYRCDNELTAQHQGFESPTLHKYQEGIYGCNITESSVLRNDKGKQRPIMVKDWRYWFEGWTSLNKYIVGREAMHSKMCDRTEKLLRDATAG